MLILFAQAAGWTDKEVLTTVVGILLGVVPVCLAVIRFATGRHRATIKKLQAETNRLRKELQDKTPHAELERTRVKLEEAQKRVGELTAECDSLRQTIVERDGRINVINTASDQQQTDLIAVQRRIERALKKDGQTWIERVRANAPEFKRLDPAERRMPILSVVNLKGGVGKTTITANLAAALDALGWRVLLLDLDLQGSLSGLFLSDAELVQYEKEDSLLNDFLEASFDAEHPKLPDYVHPILSGRSGIVPASDNLFYAESNLTIRWQLRDGTRDPRFLLRKELHLRRITNNYDIVLMDCPPVFNVCCVNALAASDYVLAPILASKQSTIRVPALLKRLREFRDKMNADLHVMGIIANRTWRSELTHDEANRLSALADISRDAYGTFVPLFENFIPSSPEVRAAEDEHRPLTPDNVTFRQFDALAREVIGNLPNFCRPAPAERLTKEVAP